MTAMDSVNPPVAADDILRLTVLMAPTTHAPARLLLLLHGRGAKILDLRWRAAPLEVEGTATLLIGLERARQAHLQEVIVRSIDVRDIML